PARSQVRPAIEDLGYSPSSAARRRAPNPTASYAPIAAEPPPRAFSADPLFSIVIRTVSVELEAADKQAVLLLASSPRSHARIERYIAGGHVDGVMLISMHAADPLPAAILRGGVPVVSYGRPAEVGRASWR